MKFNWKKIDVTNVEYEVVLSKEELDTKKKEARKLITEGIKLPGFRKNAKIPPQMLKKYETPANFAYHGARAFADEAYRFGLDEAKKANAPLPHKVPTLSIDLDDDLNATIKLTFTPEVHVNAPELSTIEVKLDEDKYTLTKEKVKNHITMMRDKLSSMVLKEKGKVEKGDTAVIDFEGSVEGEVFEGGTAKNHELVIGSGQFIPGFEDQVIGMKAGEEKNIKVTFPENYQIKHLQGVDVDFKVKLNEIRVKETIKDDKEFIETLNIEGVKTIKDLDKHAEGIVKDGLQRQKEEDFWNSTLGQIIEKADFYFPEEVVQEQFRSLKKTFEQNLASRKLTFEIYAELFGTSQEKINEAIREDALKNLKKEFIVPSIGRKMGIRVEDADIEQLAKDVLKNQLGDYTNEQLSAFISQNRNGLFRVIMEKTVREDTIDKMKRGEKIKAEVKSEKKTPKKETKTEDKPKAKKPAAKKPAPKKETTKKPAEKKPTTKKPAPKKDPVEK